MTFGKEYGGAADWIVNGGISLAVHAVIIGGVLCFGSGGGSSKSEQPATSPSSVEAKADPVAPAPIPEDERVPGVTSGKQSPAAAAAPAAQPKAKPPAAKPPQVKPQSAKPAASKPAAEKPSAAPAKDGGARTETYVVKRGDTLTAIARECGCTPAELAKLNGVSLKALSDLKFGQKIKIKAPTAE